MLSEQSANNLAIMQQMIIQQLRAGMFNLSAGNISRGWSFRKKGPGRKHNGANAHFQFYVVDDNGVRTPKYQILTELVLRNRERLYDRSFVKRLSRYIKENGSNGIGYP